MTSLKQPQRPFAIVNQASGSAQDITDELAALTRQYGLSLPDVRLSDPEHIEADMKSAIDNGADLLIVYGGDGTCKTGAELASAANIPIIPLPGGTMNMLQRSVYGTDVWQEALRLALTSCQTRWLSSGRINHHTFFVGAIIGDPTIMAEAREDWRGGDFINAVMQIPDIFRAIASGHEFQYHPKEALQAQKANAVMVSCPHISGNGANPDTQSFEFSAVHTLTLTELAEIGMQSLLSDWRDSGHVHIARTEALSVSGRQQFDILLDGEPVSLPGPLTITLEPRVVQVIAPSPQPTETA